MAELIETLEAELSHADDRVRLNRWIPQQWGVLPRIRFGRRWFNLVWLIPIGIIFLACGIPAAQELMQVPAVKEFLRRYPGQTVEPIAYSGFPLWLRLEHFFNFF